MVVLSEYFILADLTPSLAQPRERRPFLRTRGHCQDGEFLTDNGTGVLLSEGKYGHVFKTTTPPSPPSPC